MKKFILPKIKFKPDLKRILILVLVIAALTEIFVLYQAFLAAVPLPASPSGEVEPQQPVNFDLGAYQKIQTLAETKKLYEVPDYSLIVSTTTASTTITSGRENPFADY